MYEIDLQTLCVTKIHLPLECLEWAEDSPKWDDIWYDVELDDTTDVNDLVPPESDYNLTQRFSNADGKLPKNKYVYHYVLSSPQAYQAAKRLNELITKDIPEMMWPENEVLRTSLLHLLLPAYRLTFLKRSPSARPVVYARTIDSGIASFQAITGGEIIEEWRHAAFKRVNEPTDLLDLVLKEGDIDHPSANHQIPLSDNLMANADTPELYQVPITIDGNNHNQIHHYAFDVMTPEKPIYDNQGNLMTEVGS